MAEFGQLLVLDADLQKIRTRLSYEYGSDIDFYLPPLIEQWRENPNGNQPPDNPESTDNNFHAATEDTANIGTVNQANPANLNLSPDRLRHRTYNYRQMQQGIYDLELMMESFRPQYDESNSLIGHNNPPTDDITQILTLKEFEEISEALTTLRTQPEMPVDQGQKSLESARINDKSGKKILDWSAEKGNIFVDNFMKSAGKTSGDIFVAALVGLVSLVLLWLTSALSIPLPF